MKQSGFEVKINELGRLDRWLSNKIPINHQSITVITSKQTKKKKIGHPKRKLIFATIHFRVRVSFREGMFTQRPPVLQAPLTPWCLEAVHRASRFQATSRSDGKNSGYVYIYIYTISTYFLNNVIYLYLFIHLLHI